jgi:hypothetical protein
MDAQAPRRTRFTDCDTNTDDDGGIERPPRLLVRGKALQ